MAASSVADASMSSWLFASLEEYKALVALLAGVFTFLAFGLLHRLWTLPADEADKSADNAVDKSADNAMDKSAENEADKSAEKAYEVDDATLIDSFENSRPPSDPIHSFMSGEREKLPFMCPFFQAFKAAKERADKEKEEEENIARARRRRGESTPEESGESGVDVIAQALKKAADSGKNVWAASDEDAEEKTEAAANDEDNDEVAEASSIPFTHLPADLKRQEHHKLMGALSDEEKIREQEAVNSQLREIYSILSAQQGTFGDTSLDDVRSQMKLYAS